MKVATVLAFHLRPEITMLPTDETLGKTIVPKSSAALVRVAPVDENPALEEATLTEIGSPRAAAGTSCRKGQSHTD